MLPQSSLILCHSYSHYRARRLGLPPPSLNPFAKRRNDPAAYQAPAPAPGGIQGWLSDKFNSLRGGSNRTAGGAYESTSYGGGSGVAPGRDRRGFGPLDPDEAWDSRVGNEAGYYEEQELGLQDPGHGPYGGSGYGAGIGVGGIPDERGRSRSRQRELDERYDEEVHGGSGGDRLNPFGDDHEAPSLRAASPRPMVDTQGGRRGVSAHKKGQSSLGTQGSADNSPTERRSMFREDV